MPFPGTDRYRAKHECGQPPKLRELDEIGRCKVCGTICLVWTPKELQKQDEENTARELASGGFLLGDDPP